MTNLNGMPSNRIQSVTFEHIPVRNKLLGDLPVTASPFQQTTVLLLLNTQT